MGRLTSWLAKLDPAWPTNGGLLILALFHLYVALFGAPSVMMPRVVHWGVLATYGFLHLGGGRPLFRWLWAATTFGTGVYILLSWQRIALSGGVTTALDSFVGIIAVLGVLELTRRLIGMPLVVINAVLLVYALAGHHIRSFFGHRFLPWDRLVDFLYASTEGIYGIPIGVSTTYIATFLIFGAVLNEFGGASFFLHLAQALAGRFRGGAGKIAIISSALVGTLTGSAAANVATTGVFTIPAMKASGFRPSIAGAIEAVASAGGQIMPPVMGAAAFIMAEISGIPYAHIMMAALIPALLYFWSVFVMVDLEAVKEGHKALVTGEKVKLTDVLRREGYLIAPLVLLVFLLMQGRSPMQAAAFAIGLQVVLGSASRERVRELPVRLYRALTSAMRSAVPIAAACAASGIVIGVLGITGLGPKVSRIMLSFSGDNLLLALLLTMLVSIILGFGLPTTAAYIVLATVAVPALGQLGVPALAAHLFVFYFGAFSTITPPVALASYTAAGIANARLNDVAIDGMRFAAAAFILPYMWVYGPALLGMGSPFEVAMAFFTGIVGLVAVGVAVQGYGLTTCSLWERVACLVAGISLVAVGSLSNVIGVLLLVAVLLAQLRRIKMSPQPAVEA